MVNPTYGTRTHNSAFASASGVISFVADSLFGQFIAGSVITAGTQSYSVAGGTILNGGLSGDPWPRCLTMSMLLIGAGTRGGSWRISGVNQFGEPVQEDLNFNTQAGAAAPGNLYRMSTRWAYKYVTSVDRVSFTGTPSGSDTISFGLTRNTTADGGGAAVTILSGATVNGSQATQYRMFGLPIPVATSGTNAAGASSTGYQSEIGGCVVAYAGGVLVTQILSRGAGFFVDGTYSVMNLADAQAPAGPGIGIYEAQIHVQTNRWE